VLKLLTVHPDRLRANPWNTNFVSPENETKLARSLAELGQFKPLVVRELPDAATDTQFEILGGEHRWGVAKNVGITEVTIFNLGVIDDTLAKKISLADNAKYGADDTLALAKLLAEIGSADEMQQILPYSDADISAIFSASDIALDELELPESYEEPDAGAEKPERVANTHTIMRFKVPLTDAERITEMVTRTLKKQGYTSSDELTNAGDALVHIMFAEREDD